METASAHPTDSQKRAVTRALRVALAVSVLLAAILLALLAVASGADRLLEDQYGLLLGLNVVIGVALLGLALELARRLAQRYRAGIFGSRLMVRLALAFVAMTLIPVLLLYLVAVQFLSRSVESWFDVPMERALDSGLNLGRASLDALLSDLESKGRTLVAELADQPERNWPALLDRLRERAAVQEATILSGGGRILYASGGPLGQLVPDLPPPAALRQARLARHHSAIEVGDSPDSRDGSRPIRVRVIETIRFGSLPDDTRLLQLLQPVPPTLAANAEALQQGYRDYQGLALSREGLKRVFRITMTVTLLLTMFSAIASSFLLAGWLTGPLSMLAAGTRAVAEGDFRPVKDYSGRDELGVLMQSFNLMTRQLEEARALVEGKQLELQGANSRLASVLANLTAGVLVLDANRRVSLANLGAEQLLGVAPGLLVGRPVEELPGLARIGPEIVAALQSLEQGAELTWQRQLAIESQGDTPSRTLFIRVARMPEQQNGFVLVVDDVSDVVSAQRALAWTEVARRLAHEIKNPLTPIQLAAERIQLRLADRLPRPEAELLTRGTQTIVSQVGALKLMVDEFRDYARLPAARLEALDLNALIAEIMVLYGSADGLAGSAGSARNATVTASTAVQMPQPVQRSQSTEVSQTVQVPQPVQLQLDPAAPQILGDASQLRQLIHNLVKNALEATERSAQPRVEVLTETVRVGRQGQALRLVVRDNGGGFPPSILARAFEPYASTKPRGTGLGLAIVRKIVDEHGARIELLNRSDASGVMIGASVTILFTKLANPVDNHVTENWTAHIVPQGPADPGSATDRA